MKVLNITRGVLVAASLVVCGAVALSGETRGEDAARAVAQSQLEDGAIVFSKTHARKDGRTRHSYILVNNDYRVKVVVDGDSGEMIRFEKKPIASVDVPRRMREGDGPRTTTLDIDDAKEIALDRAGGGAVVKIEKEYKRNGRALYEIEVIHDNVEHEMEIDADSGEILEYSTERMKR